MTFTYNPESVGAQGKDQVRFRVGDTDPAAAEGQRLEDQEIEATIAAESSFVEAMAKCCEALAAKYFRAATSKAAASLKVTFDKRVDYLLDFAERLRNGADGVAATDIVITGTTKTEAAESKADTDLIQPAFTRGQFDNPDGTTTTVEDAA